MEIALVVIARLGLANSVAVDQAVWEPHFPRVGENAVQIAGGIAQPDFEPEGDELADVAIIELQIALRGIGVLGHIFQRFHREEGFKGFDILLRPCVAVERVGPHERLGDDGHGGTQRGMAVIRLTVGEQESGDRVEQPQRNGGERKAALPIPSAQHQTEDGADGDQQNGGQRAGVVVARQQRKDEHGGEQKQIAPARHEGVLIAAEHIEKVDQPGEHHTEKHVARGAGNQQVDDREQRVIGGEQAQRHGVERIAVELVQDVREQSGGTQHLHDGVDRDAGVH